jgi:hypothetical protein
VSRQYLNLTAPAWRQFRRNWRIAPSPQLLWQTLVPGTLFSALSSMQTNSAREKLAKANLRDAIVVLGYWRSGTTLLHELLCLDTRYTFPTTHACMNAHHFLLTEEAALAKTGVSTQRPMDEMEVRPGSPQEDEFALLALGARSPYEALLMPAILPEALKLADPRDLTEPERRRWNEVFLHFVAGVSVRGAYRPMILKSPTHGFRVSTLRELLPDARYILISRDPVTNFESVVRMWKKMFQLYAFGPIPSDDEIREAVLADRPRFEDKLIAGTAGLPANRYAALTYENLIAGPNAAIERLYQQLELGDFEPARAVIGAELARRKDYKAKAAMPSDAWRSRIEREWAPLIARHAELGRNSA